MDLSRADRPHVLQGLLLSLPQQRGEPIGTDVLGHRNGLGKALEYGLESSPGILVARRFVILSHVGSFAKRDEPSAHAEN